MGPRKEGGRPSRDRAYPGRGATPLGLWGLEPNRRFDLVCRPDVVYIC